MNFLKLFIEFVLYFGGVFILVTQILIPAFVPKLPLFWMFKKHKTTPTPPVSTLDDLKSEVDETMDQYSETKQKVEDTAEIVGKLKSKINNKN